MYPFIYQATICWYDGESHHYRIAGLGFAKDFTDAISQIEEREAENLESIEHLEFIGEKDDTLIEISPSMVRPILDRDPIKLTPYTKELT